jgi:quercetin dioxygenase-like cupin family protein
MFPRIKETVHMGALEINFLLDGDDTEGTLVQFEFVVPPNARVPAPHFHVEVDETLYILEGTLSQTIGAEIREMKAGDSCFIKRGVVHGFTNPYSGTARIFCTLTPATIGPAYFREIAEVINAGGPPDMQRLLLL